MSQEITYDADGRLIRITVWGQVSINDMVASRVESMRLHDIHGANTLIVDAREQETGPALFDIFDFGDAWPVAIQVAILVGRKTPEDLLFMETVAMQRGKKMRIFFSETEALDWLQDT
ncbi:MAG: hypothetical protein ACR2RD_09665 [Woeseiaceae bacterium]